ncbi:MAG: hypothetical protein CMJ46_14980 [Planctomyces sp.]|nr:hypothetical protein [Planctomyces sp.]
MAKKKPTRKSSQKPVKKSSNIGRFIIYPIVAVVLIIVLVIALNRPSPYYRITDEQGFIEVGYTSDKQPLYLVVSDLPLSQVTTPGHSTMMRSMTVEVPGKDSFDIITAPTNIEVVYVTPDGNIESPSDYDSAAMKAELDTLVSTYETSDAQTLGDMAVKIRQVLGVRGDEPN